MLISNTHRFMCSLFLIGRRLAVGRYSGRWLVNMLSTRAFDHSRYIVFQLQDIALLFRHVRLSTHLHRKNFWDLSSLQKNEFIAKLLEISDF
jgi:hypothetical protein